MATTTKTGSMRKTLVFIAAAGLLVAGAVPAAAGKKITGSFTVTAAPLPNYSSNTGTEKPGCLAGVEDVHWATQNFKAPAPGKLTAHVEGFQGDWDLYLTNAAGEPVVRSEAEQLGTSGGGAPPHEMVVLKLKKGRTIGITPCNWLGQPEVTVNYTFVPAPTRRR